MGVEKYFVESMEDIADLANVMREHDPEAKDPGFEHAYKYVQKQREAAFRGYMFLASEMSKQAGIYNKPLSDSNLKLSEEGGLKLMMEICTNSIHSFYRQK